MSTESPASDRKPKVGDGVWLEKEGKRYEGKVVHLYLDDDDGDAIGEFVGFTRGHDGHLPDGARNRWGLYADDFRRGEWGFLDPAPEAPKPYEPMVGDIIRLPEGRIVWLDESGDCEIAFGDDPPSASVGIDAKIIARATLVSRTEKPLAIGGKVTYRVDARATGEVISICGDFAWVQWLPGDAPVTVAVSDLRRAPEGE